MQTSIITLWLRGLKLLAVVILMAGVIVSCKKNNDFEQAPVAEPSNEQQALSAARELGQSALANAEKEAATVGFSSNADEAVETSAAGKKKNIVEIVAGKEHFTSLVAAVVKTGLVDALSNPAANLTVFAPTNKAFANLPAPFNNAANISAITDKGQTDFLRTVLLYHVLGSEVFSHQIKKGSSEAVTIKPAGTANDNTIYFSNNFGLIRINGQSTVIRADRNATNGVVHIIDKVLLFPTNTIAGIAIAGNNFSTLVAALVKTNLAGVFTGKGDFTVFAPVNSAFAKLPSPFNSAVSISGITSTAQIDALANILKYHVVASRNFAWDLGILRKITTLAAAPDNKLTTILGFNTGFVKGNANTNYSQINPADILATNGVIHVIDEVLLPKK
jgi:uncharacterized surface protein with fasciclin (FAS1) repeats